MNMVIINKHRAPRTWLLLSFVLGLALCSAVAQSNSALSQPNLCECGANPPKPRIERTVKPYASEPKDMQPYSKFAEPYDHNYIHTNVYSGAARDIPDPDLKDISEIHIGFLGPIETNPDQPFGQRMLN